MSRPFFRLDEREKGILYKVSFVLYLITLYALVAALLYREFILGQSTSEFHDIAIIVTFNALAFLCALLYLGGVSFKKLKPHAIVGIYFGLVLIGTVFNIVVKHHRDVKAIVSDLMIIMPVSAGIIGLYVLFAFVGKRKMDKDIS
jgi:hypothetical protein